MKKEIEGSNIKNVTEKLIALFVKNKHNYKKAWSVITTVVQLYKFYNLVKNGEEAD